MLFTDMSTDSEEVFETECFNCSQDGKHVQAEVFCVECEDNLCRGCLKDHNKMAKLRSHTIRGKPALKPSTTQAGLHPPTEKCFEHHGRLIDTYCASHDVVCCSVCVSIDHKSCPDVKYLPTVALGTSTSTELQDVQTTTKSVKTQLDSIKATRQENLTNVKKQRTKALESASQATQHLVDVVKGLGEKTTSEIIEKYKNIEEVVNNDLDELNKSIATLEDALNQLQNSINNDTKLFVHVKQSKRVISSSRKLAESCMTNAGVGCCTFVTDDAIEVYLKNLISIGSFEEGTEYSAVHMSDKNIKSSKDKTTCDITGICSLSDKGLMIVDGRNRSIKKLNEAYQIENQCALSSSPNAVCQTGSTEVAVTMFYDKKIQLVSVGHDLSLTRSFHLKGDGNCSCIACKDGNLYVARHSGGSSAGCVEVYNMNGILLQTIHQDNARRSIFSVPNNIAISSLSSNVFVSDTNNGLIILDKFGKLVASITYPELREAEGVCILPGNQLLVCDFAAHSAIQFDGQGKKVKTLLTSADGLRQPQVLHFDPKTFKLFVGMESSNKIKVFSLTRK